jgi:hypothetical protein
MSVIPSPTRAQRVFEGEAERLGLRIESAPRRSQRVHGSHARHERLGLCRFFRRRPPDTGRERLPDTELSNSSAKAGTSFASCLSTSLGFAFAGRQAAAMSAMPASMGSGLWAYMSERKASGCRAATPHFLPDVPEGLIEYPVRPFGADEPTYADPYQHIPQCGRIQDIGIVDRGCRH